MNRKGMEKDQKGGQKEANGTRIPCLDHLPSLFVHGVAEQCRSIHRLWNVESGESHPMSRHVHDAAQGVLRPQSQRSLLRVPASAAAAAADLVRSGGIR